MQSLSAKAKLWMDRFRAAEDAVVGPFPNPRADTESRQQLIARVRARLESWQIEHAAALAKYEQEMADWEAHIAERLLDQIPKLRHYSWSDGGTFLPPSSGAAHDDDHGLIAALAVLEALKSDEVPGPLVDCIAKVVGRAPRGL